jgi:hypothetical protein
LKTAVRVSHISRQQPLYIGAVISPACLCQRVVALDFVQVTFGSF